MESYRHNPSVNMLLSMLLLVLLVSCTGNQDKRQSGQTDADTLYPEAKLTAEIKTRLYQLPSPFEITKLLNEAGAGYIFDITNPPDSVIRYLTERRKALALGVYSADLAYSATFHRTEETDAFLKCTQKLADNLGISGVYEPGLADRIKMAGESRDSLISLANRLLDNTNRFLADNDRHYMALLIATGAFTEGIFLTCELMVAAEDNTRLTGVIWPQQELLDRLLYVMDAFRECKEMNALSLKVQKLKSLFTDYSLKPGQRLDRQQAIAMSDMVESVRLQILRTP